MFSGGFYLVGITVGGWPPVLEVSLLVLGHRPGDPDGGAAVGHAGGEVVDGGGLVEAGQAALVVLALVRVVGLDVADVVAGEAVDGLLDLGQAALLPHLERGEVGVGAGAVPVALHGLGVHGDHHAKVLSHAVEEEAGHPQVVSHLDALAGTNL